MRINMIKQFTFIEKRLIRVAFQAIQAYKKRTSVEVLMKRMLERKLIRAGYTRKANRYWLFVVYTARFDVCPRRRACLVEIEVNEVNELYAVECLVVFVKMLAGYVT